MTSDRTRIAPSSACTPVPLLDIARQNQPLEDEIVDAITQVYRSGKFILGPECEVLEDSVARLCGVTHAIGCASGSDAILLALIALDIGPGDQVICPSFTFFATASAVWRLGAEPVFVDIEADSFNIDPIKVAAAVTPNTKAIIPVHLFGRPANMDALQVIAKKHNLALVEDAAQAIGAKYNGTPVCSIGEVGCISFYPTKNLGGFGDAGMMTTNDDQLADRLRRLRAHGMQPRYYHQEVGINSRLDSMQAAALNVKMRYIDSWSKARTVNANRYDDLFAQMDANQSAMTTPASDDGYESVWNQYTIRVHHGQRDALRTHLQDRGIGSEVYYPIPLHQQECFQSLGYPKGSLPITELAASEVLSLPIFPELTEAEQDSVVSAIHEFCSDNQMLNGHAKEPWSTRAAG